MSPDDALQRISEPTTTDADYAVAVRMLTHVLLEKARQQEFFPLAGIHLVSTIADFELVLTPAAQELKWYGYEPALTCLWPENHVLLDSVIDAAPIKLAISQSRSKSMKQVLFACQSIGTITELESMAAHVLFESEEEEFETIAVLAPVAHFEAEENFKLALPKRYRNSVKWLELRKDHDLTNNGVLLPGVAMSNAERAGPRSSGVPEIFRSQYNFGKRSKPSNSPLI